MMKLNLKKMEEGKNYQKNNLYRIDSTMTVRFVEEHENTKEMVDVIFDLDENEYGIFAEEYKRPGIEKGGCKTADVLSCIIDNQKLEIHSLIVDVKSNICAFSDNLTKGCAMLTAIKEVRDFLEQIHAEMLHKDSFMIYYKDEGYIEKERIGIVTKSFEKEKFIQVASFLEELCGREDQDVSQLLLLKLKKSLMPYTNQIEKLRAFAEKKALIGNKQYDLHIFLLEKKNESDYCASIPVH